MKDSVILGSGNSRYLKSVDNFKTLYPTYDDFAAALVAGTLPVDFNGINAAGFQQVGDALGKATLLKDETASLFGLGNTAVPDDVFLKLCHGISSDVIFEAVLESSETNYIIDLRDVDYSKYSLFAFVLEKESENSINFVPVYDYRGGPSGSTGTYNNYSAIRNSNNTNEWRTRDNDFMSLSGKNDMFLFKFDHGKMTVLHLYAESFSIGFCTSSIGAYGIYGLSITKDSAQAKIKILGLNLR